MFAPPAVCGIQKANIEDESKENLVSSTEFPWVVSIQDQEYTHLTFGCILSEFWILSSASALQDRLVPQREGWKGPLQALGTGGGYTPPGVLACVKVLRSPVALGTLL